MCSTINIKDIHNSIKPVITKVKTGELAEEEEECCIDDYRQIFIDSCEAEIEMLKNKDSAKDADIDKINAGEQGATESKDQENMRKDAERSKDKKYAEMMQFYDKLSNMLVIYDPLNRPILNDNDEDMGTNRDDFI